MISFFINMLSVQYFFKFNFFYFKVNIYLKEALPQFFLFSNSILYLSCLSSMYDHDYNLKRTDWLVVNSTHGWAGGDILEKAKLFSR